MVSEPDFIIGKRIAWQNFRERLERGAVTIPTNEELKPPPYRKPEPSRDDCQLCDWSDL